MDKICENNGKYNGKSFENKKIGRLTTSEKAVKKKTYDCVCIKI